MTEQTPADPSEESRIAPRQLGEFRLLRKLGRGGMAEVWLAEQTSLERRVALKLLRKELMQDEKHVARFQREASSAGGLNHPNIVQVHLVGEEKSQHFIAQEYVNGMTLRQFLNKKGPLPLPLALHIMRQVASALKAAGDAGIVHRDIKPENIMMTRQGDVKVADFGLAQLCKNGEALDITQEGMTIGTPLYMSPEQVHGRKADPRSDIYSFGVTCYHMLAGRPPFNGPTAMSIAVKHVQEQPLSVGKVRTDLPPQVTAMVDRMLSKRPDDRYQNAEELLVEIRRALKAVRDHSNPDAEEMPAVSLAADRKISTQTSKVRRTSGLIASLIIAAGAGSAALGWVNRPTDPRAIAPRPAAGIQQLDSPRDQYLHAMFLGNNPDAFQAVIDHPDADTLWTRRAQEQLVLLDLKDRHRWEDAARLLVTLESYATDDRRYLAEALAGRVALFAYQGEYQKSRNLLESRLDDGLREELPERSPFRLLLQDAEHLDESPGK